MRISGTNQKETPTYDQKGLVDVQNIYINNNLPTGQRIREYIRQVGDPYHFLVNGTTVAIRFNGEKNLTNCLTNVLKITMQ